jgi:hypothetical protein|tara:strand:- start:5323 stop:5544 length:222 start_codon:yes stop_codon:yes gene_type:complete
MRKTYVMENGDLVEKKTIMQKRLQLISDIEPYQNTVDRGWITGRRQHREFLRKNNLVELGTNGGQIKNGSTAN